MTTINSALLHSGHLVQRVSSRSTAASTTTATMPSGSIPTTSNGVELLTVTITPVNANNTLWVRFGAFTGISNGASSCNAALFRDSATNAVASSYWTLSGAGASASANRMMLEYETLAGSTASTTFRLRVGPSGGTMYLNQDSGANNFGGVVNPAVLEVWEIAS